tara:strand:- start:5 stop:187 length:183 start_codon:yes stop_codon:yes gene_type:complete
MAIHIKDVLKLLECVAEARSLLTDLTGDTIVDTKRIRQLTNKIDKLMEDINVTQEKTTSI